MKRVEHAPLLALSRLLTPLGVLFAFALLANWPGGTGVGFVAALAMALPLALNALLLGVRVALSGFPQALLRFALVAGLTLSVAGIGLPNMHWSLQITELGAFAASVASIFLVLIVVMGRAASLRDSNW